jgi:sulfite exporter TauE/SafE
MCSPLAFAITNLSRNVFANRVVYNVGRILTYGVLGALVSSIGVALPLEKFQNSLSVGLGVLLITVGVIGASKFQSQAISQVVQKFTSLIKGQFNNQIQNKTFASYFILGSLNGILPCGLTLIALSSTILTPTPLDGFYFMLLFGLGTLPVMLGLVSVLHVFIKNLNLSISKLNMVMLIIAGGLLIGRVIFHEAQTHQASVKSQEVSCP